MRMDIEVYEDILTSLRLRAWTDLDVLQDELCSEFPQLPRGTIRSILCQEYQRHVKSTFRASHSEQNKRLVTHKVDEALHNGQDQAVSCSVLARSRRVGLIHFPLIILRRVGPCFFLYITT